MPRADRNWYAVYTVPQHEKSALKQLDIREIESFLPTYETVRVWKNRQRMKLILPLFPTYLFVHINSRETGEGSPVSRCAADCGQRERSVSLFRIPRSNFCAPTSAGNGSSRIATLLSAKKFVLRAV